MMVQTLKSKVYASAVEKISLDGHPENSFQAIVNKLEKQVTDKGLLSRGPSYQNFKRWVKANLTGQHLKPRQPWALHEHDLVVLAQPERQPVPPTPQPTLTMGTEIKVQFQFVLQPGKLEGSVFNLKSCICFC